MTQPSTIGDYIAELRRGLVCERCGRYVGGLGDGRYLPPPYPVAVAPATDDELAALIAFEWHMLGRMQQGNFVICHPQRAGRCVSYREWLAGEPAAEEDDAVED